MTTTAVNRELQHAGESEPRRNGPLAGIRLATLSHWQTAPSATMLLAWLGAEVIKIESMQHLDRYRLDRNGIENGFMFHEFNAGTLSLKLNIKTEEGARLARELVINHCDGMVSNLRVDALTRAGLGYESLLAERSDLVVAAISTGGTTGPEANMPGYATTFVAAGGLSAMSGYVDGPPAELVGWPDTAVGGWGCFAIVAALLRRMRTGQGAFVDLSAREVATAMIGDVMLDWSINGRSRSRVGNEDQIAAPHNCYRTNGDDSWVAIAVANDDEWERFRTALDAPAWTSDPRFAEQATRWEHRRELDQLLEEWTRQRSTAEVVATLRAQGVPVAPVMNSADIYGDPHLLKRKAFITSDHPIIGPRTMVGAPWRFSNGPLDTDRPAPWLGQHDQYVLTELMGLEQAEVDRLMAEQIVY